MSTQPNPTDERLGLPSGSGANRWLTCPGSHLAERGIPDSKTDDATEGEMLHAVMEFGESTHRAKLTEDQAWCIEFCRETRRKLSAELLGAEEIHAFVEERWWLRDPATLEQVASCRIDWAGFNAGSMLILDWKFGRNPVAAADVNDQLRFAAAAAWSEYSPATVYVGIVAPRAEGERVTVASFTSDQCRIAWAEMIAGAIRAMKHGQPRKPSAEACRHCRAKGTEACPESIEETTALATVTTAELATPERVADLLDKCKMAERVIESIRDRAKQLIESGIPIPRWRLKSGSKVKKVSAQAAWSRIGQKIGGAAFSEACTVSIPKLSSAWKTAHECSSDKAARAEVEALLGDAIQVSENAASLARDIDSSSSGKDGAK